MYQTKRKNPLVQKRLNLYGVDIIRPLAKSAYKKKVLFFQPEHVVGTQKYRLSETVLLSTKHLLKLMSKKIFTFFALKNFAYLNLCILHVF